MNIRRGLFRVWVAASIAWAAPVGYLTMQSALDKWSLYVSSQQKDLRDALSYEDAVKRGVDEDKGPHFDITECQAMGCQPACRVFGWPFVAAGSAPALLGGVWFLGAWIARRFRT
jgi:hypothetical protein